MTEVFSAPRESDMDVSMDRVICKINGEKHYSQHWEILIPRVYIGEQMQLITKGTLYS